MKIQIKKSGSIYTAKKLSIIERILIKLLKYFNKY